MKKPLSFFLVLAFLFFHDPVIFAQMPLAVPAAVPVPSGVERVGVVAAAKGKVELTTPGQVGRVAESGRPIFMKDEVKTDEKGHLQILLLDQTVFTIGPNSSIVIDEFIYDPATGDGKIKANITKGIFRYVSGKIGAKKPESASVELPTASIGFRGTIVGGQVNQDGSALAALLGPGSNNNAGEKIGSFVMNGTGDNTGDSQEVNRTGFGARAGADGSISGVFQLSQEEINGLTAGLAPSGGNNNQGGEGDGLMGGGSATDASGEGVILTGDSGNDANALGLLSAVNDDTTAAAAQDSAATTTAVADGITTMEELTRIVTGTYHYSGSGTFIQTQYSGSASSYPGVISASWDINFGSKQFENASVSICTASTCGQYAGGNIDVSNLGLSSVPFGSSGSAVFSTSGTDISATVTLLNSGGQIAQNGQIQVQYSSGSSYVNEGNGGFTVAHS